MEAEEAWQRPLVEWYQCKQCVGDSMSSSVVLRSVEIVYRPQTVGMAILWRKKSISPIKHLPIDVQSPAQRAVESINEIT